MITEFIWPIRVYYEDTDAGGIVYYANYLKFYERARTEWLNHLKINQAELLKHNIVFVVTKAEIDYLKPARFNDQLIVKTALIKVSAATIEFEQTIYLEAKEQLIVESQKKRMDNYEQQNHIQQNHQPAILLNKATIKVACLKLESFSPCRMPTTIKEEFQRVC